MEEYYCTFLRGGGGAGCLETVAPQIYLKNTPLEKLHFKETNKKCQNPNTNQQYW